MKRYILAVAAVFLSIFAARAEEQRLVYSLLINTQSGETIEYEFAKEPKATFQGNNLLISLGDRQDVAVYPMGDIKNITFEGKKDISGVDEVSGQADHITVKISDTEVNIAGLSSGATVQVYSAAGALVASATADAEGCISISTDGLSQGVYVVTIPGHSFKFIK